MKASSLPRIGSFSIGSKVFAVGSIGVLGMALVGATLFWALGRLDTTTQSIDKAHRVGAILVGFNNELSQSRAQFDSFKETRKKASLESSESLMELAQGSLRQVEAEQLSSAMTEDITKAKELVQTIRDSIIRVIPHGKRTGPQSLEGMAATLRGHLDILIDKRREFAGASDKPWALPGMELAMKISDIAALIAEAEMRPEQIFHLKFGAEVGEAETAIDAIMRQTSSVADLKQRLGSLETAFTAWLDAAVATQNDTAIASNIFDIVTPVITRIIDLNTKAAETARSDANRVKRQMTMTAAGLLLLSLLIAALTAWRVGRSITRPIASIRDAMKRLAEGATDQVIPHTAANTEIGSMARSVQVFQNAMLERQRLTGDQLKAANDQASRSKSLEGAAQSFEASLGETQQALVQSSERLNQFAGALARMSDTLDRHARESLDASTGTAERSASVATAADELSHSIAEISSQTDRANAAVQNAVLSSNNSQKQMLQLKESAAGISSIVEIINTVAAQTNLLALNATIEAARAGDAGRGFAVVAQEIKALAQQTANATAEISRQILEIQQAASDGAATVGALGTTLAQVEESSVAVSAAVRQQDQSVTEIAQIMAGLRTNADAAMKAANRTFEETEEAKSMAQAMVEVSNSVADVSIRFESDAQRFVKVVNAA
jgi:methyl-accepting chemotaxis protein